MAKTIFQLFNASSARAYKPVKSVTVIIPTLNEGDLIRGCIQALNMQSEIREIIVADAGSRDQTTTIASEIGARVISCEHKGRGMQICKGIEHAGGDVVLIIHADCRLRKGSAARLLTALNRMPTISGGAFGMAFTTQTFGLKVIAVLNNLRAKLTGISFGDQGQFLRAQVLDRIGGFPKQMLMEDVELSLRLRKAGATILLHNGMDVSARRWKKQAFLKRVLKILSLFTCYLLWRHTRSRDATAQSYYRRYYD